MDVIITHENADFDAIASLLGAHKLYPGAQPILPHRINRNVQAFLSLYGSSLPFLDPDALPRGKRIRRVIAVDTQKLGSVRGMGHEVDEVLIIDHHAPPSELPEHWTFQGETVGANATLLVEGLSARLVPVSPVEATLLLTGIYEDTGTLTYGTTTSRDLRAAGWLLEQGANLRIASEFLEHPLSPAQQLIYDDLQAHAETLDLNGHPVVISWAVSPPGSEEEISTLAHKLRNLLDPSALFIVVDVAGNSQLVARSSTEDINVAEIAQRFGGGGHDHAAAALIRQRPVEEVYHELKELLPEAVEPRIKVRDVMSTSVRTVAADETVESLGRQMRQTGHEGFPVVNREGEIVGLVTRNAVDRALQHHWETQPVHRIMQPGAITVSLEDSVEKVRTLMIQRGWGQIPVVEDGRPIGVVTRTDLIRLPSSTIDLEREQIAHRMEEAFPAPLLTLIRRIGARAAQSGHVIYFVGGIVRDLLLAQPITDVDVVVEGDAIALGEALAEAYGGSVRAHSRFGTVKWILPETIWAQMQDNGAARPGQKALPVFIDLVTARTEFYEHPTALPMVSRSSIKQDLHRRDFTINTLAIRLDPQRWGEMLDFYGGKEDLSQGILRVLHSLSFVDDPTRILRAARFEARLGFHLDRRSEALIHDSLPLLARVSGGRLRHELDLIFNEAHPEAALDRLQELGALQQICPDLQSDVWLHEQFERVRSEWKPQLWDMANEQGRSFMLWALFLSRLDATALSDTAHRLSLPREIFATVAELPTIQLAVESLEPTALPSAVAAALDAFPLAGLAVAWISAPSAASRDLLATYAAAWRHVTPSLTGDDLRAMGFRPGPAYRLILSELRAARLDGRLRALDEERAYVIEHYGSEARLEL